MRLCIETGRPANECGCQPDDAGYIHGTYDPAWTVYQAPSGHWVGRNARGRDFLVRDSREEAERAIEAHKQRINTYGRKS